MAWSFDINNASANFSTQLYDLKELLKTVGWTVVQSSTGPAGSVQASDVLTTPALVNGVDTVSGFGAWFRMRDPASQREFVVQRRTDGTGAPEFGAGTQERWLIRYSADAGFITGATAGSPPTASDQITLDDGTTGGRRASGRYDIVAGGSAEGYSFALIARTSGTGNVVTGIGLDVVADAASEDLDPAVFFSLSAVDSSDHFGNPETAPLFIVPVLGLEGNGQGAFGWMHYGAEYAQAVSWVPMQLCQYNGTLVINDAMLGSGTVINGYNTEVDMVPLVWGRAYVDASNEALLPGIKGVSRIFQMNSPSAIADGDTTTGLTRAYWSCISIPWDGATTPTV